MKSSVLQKLSKYGQGKLSIPLHSQNLNSKMYSLWPIIILACHACQKPMCNHSCLPCMSKNDLKSFLPTMHLFLGLLFYKDVMTTTLKPLGSFLEQVQFFPCDGQLFHWVAYSDHKVACLKWSTPMLTHKWKNNTKHQ